MPSQEIVQLPYVAVLLGFYMSNAYLLMFELVIIKGRMSCRGWAIFYSLDEIKFSFI
jgi:hypothetical protein